MLSLYLTGLSHILVIIFFVTAATKVTNVPSTASKNVPAISPIIIWGVDTSLATRLAAWYFCPGINGKVLIDHLIDIAYSEEFCHAQVKEIS